MLSHLMLFFGLADVVANLFYDILWQILLPYFLADVCAINMW